MHSPVARVSVLGSDPGWHSTHHYRIRQQAMPSEAEDPLVTCMKPALSPQVQGDPVIVAKVVQLLGAQLPAVLGVLVADCDIGDVEIIDGM